MCGISGEEGPDNNSTLWNQHAYVVHRTSVVVLAGVGADVFSRLCDSAVSSETSPIGFATHGLRRRQRYHYHKGKRTKDCKVLFLL